MSASVPELVQCMFVAELAANFCSNSLTFSHSEPVPVQRCLYIFSGRTADFQVAEHNSHIRPPQTLQAMLKLFWVMAVHIQPAKTMKFFPAAALREILTGNAETLQLYV